MTYKKNIRTIAGSVLLLALASCLEAERTDLDPSSTAGYALINQILNPSGGSSSLCESLGKCIFVAPAHDGDFATVTSGNGNGVFIADQYCASNRPAGLSGSYKAFMIDGNNRTASPAVDWALQASTSYYRYADNARIDTTDASALLTFPLDVSLSTNVGYFWTGLVGATWGNAANRCFSTVSWNTTSGGLSGRRGDLSALDENSIDVTFSSGLPSLTCDQTAHVLCVQQ